MGQTDRPDDRRAAGSRLPSNSESAVKRNHETPKSGIPKRKKIEACPRLSCKIQYLLASNHRDQSTTSEYFTDDSVGDNSRNFFSAASYTLTWSIGNSALRSLALFCAASSVGNTVFIRPSTSKPKPSVITRSARVMLRGCGSSDIVRGFFMATPRVAPSPSNHCPPRWKRATLFREVYDMNWRI